jgi:hypothetical protein
MFSFGKYVLDVLNARECVYTTIHVRVCDISFDISGARMWGVINLIKKACTNPSSQTPCSSLGFKTVQQRVVNVVDGFNITKYLYCLTRQ